MGPYPGNLPRIRKGFLLGDLLRGSGYLGYVDSNQGEKKSKKRVICPQILGL